jgi:hypothetical protein
MEIILKSKVLGDNPILTGIDYTVNLDYIQFNLAIGELQSIVSKNIEQLISEEKKKSFVCNIITLETNFPQHLILLVFRCVVHRFNGITVDGVLVAQHGPIE